MSKLITTKEEKEQVMAWLDALRSGNYKQCTSKLQMRDSFCCLGVACKVLIPEGKLTKSPDGSLVGYNMEKQVNAPAWLLRINNYLHIRNGTSLTTLNDLHKANFKMIADYIEECLKPELDLIND